MINWSKKLTSYGDDNTAHKQLTDVYNAIVENELKEKLRTTGKLTDDEISLILENPKVDDAGHSGYTIKWCIHHVYKYIIGDKSVLES